MSTTLQITVDPALAEWLTAEAKARGYDSVDEFAGDLLGEERSRSSGDWMEPMIQEAMARAPHLSREEIRRRLSEHIEKQIDAAIAEGGGEPITPETWKQIRQEAHELAAGRKAP